MSFLNQMFGDNPSKRDELVRLSSKVYTQMDSNFRTVNELIDCIHKYIPGRIFKEIKLDEKESITSNCNVIIQRMNEIESFMTVKMHELKSKIDKDLFDKLMKTDTKISEKVRLAEGIVGGGMLSLGDVMSSLGGSMLSKKNCFGAIALVATVMGGAWLVGIKLSISAVIGVSIFAVIGLGFLNGPASQLISAFIGNKEESQLEKPIKELEEVINTFEPASYKFNKDVMRLIIKIEDKF